MILGGGKAAFETAGSCFEQGAEKVYMVFRTAQESTSFSEEELTQVGKQGIRFIFQSAVTRMMGEGPNLTHVEIAHISEQGEEEGERELLLVDSLLTGTGRFPELIYVPRIVDGENEETETNEVDPLKPVQWETLVPYAGPFAKQDTGIFRPGEVTNDYKAVVEAIGSGRRAAGSIHRFLTEEPVEAPDNMIREYTRVLSLDELEPVSEVPRQKMPELAEEEQISDPCKEIALGFSEEQALKEAGRCLQCGLICYRRVEQKGH